MPIDKLSGNSFATGAVANSLGYTPANKAGDTFTGAVGIGNTSPGSYLLSVGDGSSNRGRIYMKGATSGAYPEINMDDTGNSGKNYQLISSANNWFINDQTGGGLTRLFISSNGNIGIGNSTPTMSLDVFRSSSNAQIKINTASATSVPQLELRNTQAGCQIGMPADTNAMNFITADTERMRISSNGNIGIGTTSPNTQLYVKGSGSSTFGAYNDPLTIEGTNYSYMHLKGVNGQAGILYNKDGSTGWFYGLDNSGNLKAAYLATINEAGVTGAKDGTSTGFRVESGGNFLFNSGYGGIAAAYGCRAWVNFAGSNGVISGSGNVSSVTDNGTGDYTVNFSAAMPDANYCVTTAVKPAGNQSSTNGKVVNVRYDGNLATSSVRLWCNSTAGVEDFDKIFAAIFR